MKRSVLMFASFVLLTFIAVQLSEAGLINYNRKGRRGGQAPAQTTPAYKPVSKPVAPPVATVVIPEWKKTAQPVKTDTESSYDINRDGKLQTAEAKILLRDVIGAVDEKGSYVIDSDILKPYDKNKDTVITRSEVEEIRKDVSN